MLPQWQIITVMQDNISMTNQQIWLIQQAHTVGQIFLKLELATFYIKHKVF